MLVQELTREQAGIDADRVSGGRATGVPVRARHASDDAFVAWLYAEYAGPLTSFVQRLTGDPFWTEDVVQEALVRAWRNGDQLVEDGPKSLLPWLATVARRIVISEWRRRDSRPAADEALIAAIPVEDRTDEVLCRMVVDEALRTLSPAHREAVADTHLAGRSIEEVAAARQLPPGTVKSRVHYGMRALRKALGDRGVTAA